MSLFFCCNETNSVYSRPPSLHSSWWTENVILLVTDRSLYKLSVVSKKPIWTRSLKDVHCVEKPGPKQLTLVMRIPRRPSSTASLHSEDYHSQLQVELFETSDMQTKDMLVILIEHAMRITAQKFFESTLPNRGLCLIWLA